MEQARDLEHNIALVGASSLKGKEVKEVLQERNFPMNHLTLLDEEDMGGQLTELGDEPVVIHPARREYFKNVTFALFASSLAFTRECWPMAEASGCQIVDLSYCLEAETRARLRAPLVENLWANGARNSPSSERSAGCRLFVSAHSAAIAIASVLGQLSRKFPVIRSAVTVFEPASERGKAGIDELHRQTVNLFAFQQGPREVYDSQVAFNLLSSCGERCQPTLREIQDRIQSHIRRLLDGRVAQPSLRLLQAPIFHGYPFSCFVELNGQPKPEEVKTVLAQRPLALWRNSEMDPSAVGVAGSGKIVLGPVEPDSSCESGFWLWGAVDNLRLAARNAVEIIEDLIAAGDRPTIRVQGGIP